MSTHDIHCSKEDAKTQIRLVFNALPLDARRFNLDAIAERCAECLTEMTNNKRKIALKKLAEAK